MERSEEHQKYILVAMEDKDLYALRNVGQALNLKSPTSMGKEALMTHIAEALREPKVPAGKVRIGRPSLGGVEGAEILKKLDEKYYESRVAPLKILAGAHSEYPVPTVPLSEKPTGKAYLDKVLRGQRVLLYSIDPSAVRGALTFVAGNLGKSGMETKAVVCDGAPEQAQSIAREIGGDVCVTSFVMTPGMQSDIIVAEIRTFLERNSHGIIMIEDAGVLAEVAALGGGVSENDAVRIICGLAAAGDESSTTLICGTNDEDFVKKYGRMFNHVCKI